MEIEDIASTDSEPKEYSKLKNVILELLKYPTSTFNDASKFYSILNTISRKFKFMPSKRDLGLLYKELHETSPQEFPMIDSLRTALVQKAVRSASGILNISVSLPPDKFSCKYNCYFCPNEPGMPRSYLSNEDVFKRAQQVDFDTVRQVHVRLQALEKNGHVIDKIEFRVLGGTFSCYDHTLADTFIRDLYYAANTFYEDRDRPRGTIEEEQRQNVTAQVHVVGLGVETRPDEITQNEIKRFRHYGVTRVEIGVQHTDDNLLRKINRGHLTRHSKQAIKLLKDYGFKVEIHIMADLPGATPEGDMECYRQVLQTDPDLTPDYLKDYPCLDVDYTIIKEWKQQNKWQPYAERTADARDLREVLIYRQSITPKWVRVNRVQRDFQEAKEGRLGYTSKGIRTNFSQIVKDDAEARGIYCQCIRCCELRNQSFNPKDIEYKITNINASGATEYFISAEIPENSEHPHRHLLLGFLRLRLSPALKDSIIPELKGETAMIRELHVYGRMKAVGQDATGSAQHMGIGRNLLKIAESISQHYGFTQIAVISGIGVRGYYQKRGYNLKGSYMIKRLPMRTSDILIVITSIFVCIFIATILVY